MHAFLKKRFEALSAHPLYHGMEYSDDKKQIEEWIPAGHGRPRSKRGSCGDANA